MSYKRFLFIMSNKVVSLSIWLLLVIATNSISGGTCASRPRPAICHRICALFQHCFNSLARTMGRLFHYPNFNNRPHVMAFLIIARWTSPGSRSFSRSSVAVSAVRSEYQRVLDYRFPSVHPRRSWAAARGHTLFTDTYRRESTHVPNGSGLCESAHVKSLYERSIVGRIMNSTFCVHRIYLAIRPPAPSRVFTRSCGRPLPAQCPRSIRRRWNPTDRRNHCTCAEVCQHISRWYCIVCSWSASRFIASEKRKGARKTFTCAIYTRGVRRQRY